MGWMYIYLFTCICVSTPSPPSASTTTPPPRPNHPITSPPKHPKHNTTELKTSEHTSEAGAIQKGADFLQAFMMGFEVQDAVALLRLEDLFIDSFMVRPLVVSRVVGGSCFFGARGSGSIVLCVHMARHACSAHPFNPPTTLVLLLSSIQHQVTDVKLLHGDHLSRAIGRIAGQDGKTVRAWGMHGECTSATRWPWVFCRSSRFESSGYLCRRMRRRFALLGLLFGWGGVA